MKKCELEDYRTRINLLYTAAREEHLPVIQAVLQSFKFKCGKVPIDILSFAMRYNIKAGKTRILKYILETYKDDIIDVYTFKGSPMYHPYKYAIKYNNEEAMKILESYDLADYKYALIMASKYEFKKVETLRIKYQDYMNNLSIFDSSMRMHSEEILCTYDIYKLLRKSKRLTRCNNKKFSIVHVYGDFDRFKDLNELLKIKPSNLLYFYGDYYYLEERYFLSDLLKNSIPLDIFGKDDISKIVDALK